MSSDRNPMDLLRKPGESRAAWRRRMREIEKKKLCPVCGGFPDQVPGGWCEPCYGTGKRMEVGS